MGLAFPKRFTRSALGPKLQNNYPVENPNSDIGDATFNGMFAAIAGLNLTAPRVTLVAAWNGSAFTYTRQDEAWNDDRDQAHPALTRTSTGLYVYTFAATYLDEDGIAVNTILTAPRASCHADTPVLIGAGVVPEAFAWIDSTNPLAIKIQVGSRVLSTGVFTVRDYPFWLTAD